MEAVAHTLDDVDSFAVARLPEAVQLHESGIDKPLVLLAGQRQTERVTVR